MCFITINTPTGSCMMKKINTIAFQGGPPKKTGIILWRGIPLYYRLSPQGEVF